MIKHLFVYGTLRKSRSGVVHPYLSNLCVFVDQASLPGRLFRVNHYPGAIPTPPHSRFRVYGEVYRMSHPVKLLDILDDYEECSSHFPTPHEYRRVPETVALANGGTVRAWIYWYRHSIAGLPEITSGDYFDEFLTPGKPDASK
ncbi:MAG: gamma-glutamylcyclotransferase family protein [Gammaproteobacteria bacterium]